MATIDVINQAGAVVGSIELNDAVSELTHTNRLCMMH